MPNKLIPPFEKGSGDYIELAIEPDGTIRDWPATPDFSEFVERGQTPQPVKTNKWYRAERALQQVNCESPATITPSTSYSSRDDDDDEPEYDNMRGFDPASEDDMEFAMQERDLITMEQEMDARIFVKYVSLKTLKAEKNLLFLLERTVVFFIFARVF